MTPRHVMQADVRYCRAGPSIEFYRIFLNSPPSSVARLVRGQVCSLRDMIRRLVNRKIRRRLCFISFQTVNLCTKNNVDNFN